MKDTGDFSMFKGVRPFLLLVLILAMALALRILFPFVDTIIFGSILATLVHPFYERLLARWPSRPNLSSLVVVVGVIFVIIIPVGIFLGMLANQGVGAVNTIINWIDSDGYKQVTENVWITQQLDQLNDYLGFVDLSTFDPVGALMSAGKATGQYLVGLGADAARNAASIVIDFAIMIFLLFYLLRDGKQMVHTIKYLSPLRSDQEDRIVSRMRMVTRSAILGNFLTALAQGVAGGIGFAIVGIPAFFWGAVLGLASFVPVVGTTLVWGPAVIYLVVIGNWKLAIFLFVWSAVLVGSIDNFLRPFFMRGGAEMSPFYIFLSLLGGIQIFGLAGIIYGPLIIAFAKVMIYIYQVEYKDLLDENEGGRFTGPDEADEDASAENA